MPRTVYDGNFKVSWLDSAPASAAAPTMAEIAAGTDVTAFLAKDGFGINITNNKVTGGDLSTKFTDQDMGTWTADITLTAYFDDGDGSNVAWDTFTDFSTGCFIATPFGEPEAGALAHVFPQVRLGVRAPGPTAENARQKFTVSSVASVEPVLDAVVAA